MPKKKPEKAARPQFDAEPLDDEEQPPFTFNDDGEMVLVKPEPKPEETSHGGKKGGARRQR
jgi:hypothetical protein